MKNTKYFIFFLFIMPFSVAFANEIGVSDVKINNSVEQPAIIKEMIDEKKNEQELKQNNDDMPAPEMTIPSLKDDQQISAPVTNDDDENDI